MKQQYKNIFKHIDDYLFGDLETLFDVDQQEKGDLGYTTFQVISSGIELLGMLISNKKDEVAYNYWLDNHLSKINDKYGNEKYQKILRNSGRDGIAHIFMAKSCLSISRNDGDHLGLGKKGGMIYLQVNCYQFYLDFLSSYTELMRKLESGAIELKGIRLFENEIQTGELKIQALMDELGIDKYQFKNVTFEIPGSSSPVDLDDNWKDVSTISKS